MKVPKTCFECGKERDPKIKSISYYDEDDVTVFGDHVNHRAVFCSKACRIEFLKGLERELLDDDLLVEIEET